MAKMAEGQKKKISKTLAETLAKRTEENKKNFLLAYAKTDCCIADSCDIVGICRRTYREYLTSDEKFESALSDIKENLIDRKTKKLVNAADDVYEDVLDKEGKVIGRKLIKAGDWRALDSWLRAEAKHRGYGNTVDVKTEGVIRIKFTGLGSEFFEDDEE